MNLRPDLRELDRPIPPLVPVAGWQGVPICECGDPLIALSEVDPVRIVELGTYLERGFRSACSHLYVRKQVAQLLLDVVSELPSGLRLGVFDSWRPSELQSELFADYLRELRGSNPSRSESELVKHAKRYVSFPANDPTHPAPHLTGGAVDLTLCDGQGEMLPMGTKFDYFGPEAATRFFEEISPPSGSQTRRSETLENRRLLFHVMIKHGFTNYPEEWWHFDYGNQFWARAKGGETRAIYGPASPGNDLPVTEIEK